MDQFLYDFVKNATLVQKGLFLMVAGVSFVFLVQFVFFLIVKIWTRKKPDAAN